MHLPWGVPIGGEGSSSCLLTQQDYVTLYSNALHIPLWTAFKLSKSVRLLKSYTYVILCCVLLSSQQASMDRLSSIGSCLRRDPRLPPPNSSNCTDYTAREGGEYVPVRLSAAAALSTDSTPQQLTTNLLSSVVPQMEKFNKSKQSTCRYL